VEGSELVSKYARYRALIVPAATDLPQECVDILETFAKAGGVLLFVGDLPERETETQASLTDAVKKLPGYPLDSGSPYML